MLVSPGYYKFKPRAGTRFDPYAPLARGLLVQYLFNDGSAKSFNSARTVLTTPLTNSPAYTDGKYGECLKLVAGSNQYGVLPVTGSGLDSWNSTGTTLACAFRITAALPTFSRLIEKGANNEITLAFNFTGSDSKLHLQVLGGAGSAVATTNNLFDGLTHIAHVTVTTSLNATLYVDGVSIGSTSSGTPAQYSADIQLGRFSGGSSNNFTGLFEGFWGWNRALLPQEVLLHSFDPFSMYQPRRRTPDFHRSASARFRRTLFDRVGSRGAA